MSMSWSEAPRLATVSRGPLLTKGNVRPKTAIDFANKTLDPVITSPQTLDAIGEISRTLIDPYGPAVLDCQPPKSEVAVLVYAAGVWFPDGKRPPGDPNDATVPYAALLMRNHVLLDDDVPECQRRESNPHKV